MEALQRERELYWLGFGDDGHTGGDIDEVFPGWLLIGARFCSGNPAVWEHGPLPPIMSAGGRSNSDPIALSGPTTIQISF